MIDLAGTLLEQPYPRHCPWCDWEIRGTVHTLAEHVKAEHPDEWLALNLA